jgi:CRP/FNR family transcriptional regulator, anaerobic regulatory protein
MDQLLAYLNAIHPLSPSLSERLQAIVCFKTLSKHAFQLKAGQVNREICFIKKGLLRCYYLKDGKEVSSWFLKEGDIIVSVESFYDQVASYEYIQALEPCELFHISYLELQSLYGEFPEFNFIGRELTVKYLKLWTRQLYNLRTHTAAERYQFLLEKEPEIIQRVPDKHLASYLDINKITYSRIKGEFCRGSGDNGRERE